MPVYKTEGGDNSRRTLHSSFGKADTRLGGAGNEVSLANNRPLSTCRLIHTNSFSECYGMPDAFYTYF